MPTAFAAAPGAAKDVPPDTDIVQIVDTCALTKGGRVLCWGDAYFLGGVLGKAAHAPRPLQGLPPVRRIGSLGRGLLAVTTDGRTLHLTRRLENAPAIEPLAIPAPEEISGSTARLSDGRVYQLPNGLPPAQVDVPPIRKLFDSMDCGAGEDGNAYCWGDPDFVKRVVGTVEGDKRVRLSLPRGRMTSGVAFWEGKGQSARLHACAVYEDHVIHCTHPGTEAKLANWGEIRRLSFHGSTICAILESGKVRCHVTQGRARPPDQDRLTWHSSEVFGTALDKLQGVEELSGRIGYMCARYGGKVACWGEHRQLGDGIDPTLHAPVLVQGLPKLVSLEGYLTQHCGLDAEGHAHCFSSDARVPGPFELPLPELAVQFLGTSGYGCMKGAKSGKWYCRSVGFIRGTAPHGFAPLLDPRGRPVVDPRAINLVWVTSIEAELSDGTWGFWSTRAGEQPLRLKAFGKLPVAPKGERALLGGCLAGSDGKLWIYNGSAWEEKKGFVGIVSMAICHFDESRTSPACGLDEAGGVWCSLKRGEPWRVAEGVVDLSPECYVTKAGAAYCLDEKNGALPFTKVEGLPEVVRAVERCALTKAGEVYCWGDRYNAGTLGTFRAEPVELTFPAATH